VKRATQEPQAPYQDPEVSKDPRASRESLARMGWTANQGRTGQTARILSYLVPRAYQEPLGSMGGTVSVVTLVQQAKTVRTAVMGKTASLASADWRVNKAFRGYRASRVHKDRKVCLASQDRLARLAETVWTARQDP